MHIDRERQLIIQYDDAHRAYLGALDAVRAAVFGEAAVDRVKRAAVTRAKHRLADAERELQEYWSTQAIAQEVSR